MHPIQPQVVEKTDFNKQRKQNFDFSEKEQHFADKDIGTDQLLHKNSRQEVVERAPNGAISI